MLRLDGGVQVRQALAQLPHALALFSVLRERIHRRHSWPTVRCRDGFTRYEIAAAQILLLDIRVGRSVECGHRSVVSPSHKHAHQPCHPLAVPPDLCLDDALGKEDMRNQRWQVNVQKDGR